MNQSSFAYNELSVMMYNTIIEENNELINKYLN